MQRVGRYVTIPEWLAEAEATVEGVECTERKVECLVMSRVVGYLTPVKFWHKAKQQEMRDRKVYRVPEDDDGEQG